MNSPGKNHRFTKRLLAQCIGMLSIAISAGADNIRFINSGDNQNWTNADNWICTNSLKNHVIPGDDDEARIGNAAMQITTPVTVGNFKSGVGGPANVIINGGSLLAVKTCEYNSACYLFPGTLVIKNGGSAAFGSYFMVGFKDTQGGVVKIHDGTVRVARVYFHNEQYEGADPLDTRTTIYTGGLLEVGALELNAGVMDIAGGAVVVKNISLEKVFQWIEDGRLTAMGGKEGWKIKTTSDPATGYITMVAEPAPVNTPVADGVRAKTGLSAVNQLLIGLTGTGLLFLFTVPAAFYLYRRKQKSEKKKLDEENGSTYKY
ncbi:MAG: hypothetical protein MUC65_08285 [Pontiellaceae bacterium]|jgi:hypothetical protein|nr:hypothetical protein [Pontiellaceae bacterium]